MNARQMPIDEVCWRLGDGVRRGRLTGWSRGFALSIMKQAKRGTWEPSVKQETLMRRLVDGIRQQDTGPLIDEADDG